MLIWKSVTNNDTIVEEKSKREEQGEPCTSKRFTRRMPKIDPPRQKEREPMPGPEEVMEDSAKNKKQEQKGKQKGPAYKLQYDIELATDLKKVLEERYLNSKVELSLGEVLGIAKWEFQEQLVDIIKRGNSWVNMLFLMFMPMKI